MFVLNNYVSSFTSEYTKKEAVRRIKSNAEALGISQSDEHEDKFTANMKNIPFSPILNVNVDEKVEGSVVFVRMSPLPFMRKALNVIFALLGIITLLLFALSILGKLSLIVPILAFFVFFCLRIGVDRLWAKRGCIKAFKKLGKALGYSPDKVIIFKVKKP